MNNSMSTTNNNNNNNDINKKEQTINNYNANNVNNENKKEERINNSNININSNTNMNANDQREKKVEEKSENQIKLEEDIYSKYSNTQKLRKTLSQKNKQKLQILRKYFHKLHEGGIILSLRKSTKSSLSYKKIENVYFEISLRTVINNQEMNDITIDENIM